MLLTEGAAHNRNGTWNPPLNQNVTIPQVAPLNRFRPVHDPTCITQQDLAAIEGPNYKGPNLSRELSTCLDSRYCALKDMPRAVRDAAREAEQAARVQYDKMRNSLKKIKRKTQQPFERLVGRVFKRIKDKAKQPLKRQVKRSNADALRQLHAQGPDNSSDDTEDDGENLTADQLRDGICAARYMPPHEYRETSRGVRRSAS